MSAGVFVARCDQITFVISAVWTGGLGGLLSAGEIAGDHVDQAVGAEHQRVWPMLDDVARELQDRLDDIRLTVLIVVCEPIKGGPLRTVANDEDAPLTERIPWQFFTSSHIVVTVSRSPSLF